MAPANLKDDADKLPMNLIPPEAFRYLAKVLAAGAAKYAPRGWEQGGLDYDRLIAGVLRHITAASGGDWYDLETDTPHLANAMCGLMFILTLATRGLLERPVEPKHG